MALSSLNPGSLFSSQRLCDSRSRVHRPLGRCHVQGLNVDFTLQVEQPWRQSSLLPPKMMNHAGFHGGSFSQKESRNMECHAQVHSESWNMDDEALPSLDLSSRDRERSGRLASAVGLIMGTAVGPGILGLPAATLHVGLIPSSVTIVAVWAYVMASILLVAELSYAVMAEQGGGEVSFTGLAARTLGPTAGRMVALTYAFLNYALLVACVSGLHSILSHWLPLPPTLLCLLSPGVVVSMLAFTSFHTVDALNKLLCCLMLASITALVAIGANLAKTFSLTSGTWSFTALYPAIPVIVLTLGFHVITPVVCELVGGNPKEARKAILLGGSLPLSMVLAWNTVIVGLAQGSSGGAHDPIKLLLSLSSTAAPVVQAFAFAALGTTLIGYALSFPKQLIDTLSLFLHAGEKAEQPVSSFRMKPRANEKVEQPVSLFRINPQAGKMVALLMAMAPPVVLAMTSPGAFASALDFAGLYANCFLFGVLPPIMAWVYRYPEGERGRHTELVPGGRVLLLVLLLVAVYLGLKPPHARI